MKFLIPLLATLNFYQLGYANTLSPDTHIPGYSQHFLLKKQAHNNTTATTKPYTVIPYDYNTVLQESQNDINQLISENNNRNATWSINQLVENVGYYFEHTKHTPYNAVGAMGEGDWRNNNFNVRGYPHIQQDPIYRTDVLDCVTLVNIAMGLINSHTLAEFNNNIFQIAYGANQWSNKYPINEISYRNRDNFVSGSFNPINQKNKRLADTTAHGIFSNLVKQTQAAITRAKWFSFQAEPDAIANHVRVLEDKKGDAMADRLSDPDNFNAFPSQSVAIQYIPKNILAKKVSLSSHHTIYIADESKINQIVTPAVVEIVRDINKWNIGKKSIRDIIGSGINVSHIALLYHHSFLYGQTIYHQVRCNYNDEKQKTCSVKPILCSQKQGCYKVMMLAATDVYPDGYVWSNNVNTKNYYCTSSSDIPTGATPITACNRVMTMPLGDYLTRYEYGRYTFMDSPSIVGINIERILPNQTG